jgi:hypothetical protein
MTETDNGVRHTADPHRDDEYITAEGYLEPPEGSVSVLSGFYYISKLFRREFSITLWLVGETDEQWSEASVQRTTVCVLGCCLKLSAFYRTSGYMNNLPYRTLILTVLGRVLDKRRRDRRKAPSGIELQMRLNEVDRLFEDVMTLMDDCPRPLKLDMTPEARPPTYVLDGASRGRLVALKLMV